MDGSGSARQTSLKQLLHLNIWILFISNLGNVVNYLLQMFLGRTLSTADFGVFNAVNSLGVILTSVAQVVPTVMTKGVIDLADTPRARSLLIAKADRYCLLGGAALVVLLLIGVAPVGRFLKVDEVAPLALYAVAVATTLPMHAYTGILQGLYSYLRVVTQTLFHGVQRLALTVAAVAWLGMSYNAAIAAIIVANVTISAWMVHSARRVIPGWRARRDGSARTAALPQETVRDMRAFAIPVAGNWLLLSLLTNIDLVLVKHFFSDEQAGQYAIAAILGRIAIFLTLNLVTTLVPEAMRQARENRSSLSVILLTLSMTALVAGGYFALVSFFGEALITMMFGERYAPAAVWLPLVTAAMSGIAVLTMINSFLLARGTYRFLVPALVAAAIGLTLVSTLRPTDPSDIAWGIAMTTLGTAIVTVVSALLHQEPPQRRNQDALA